MGNVSHTRQSTRLHDGNGNKIDSFKNGLTVHLGHGHNSPVNVYFQQHTGVEGAFAIAPSSGDYQLQFVNATGFEVGDYLHIHNSNPERTMPKITEIAGNAVKIDRPLDNNHTTNTVIHQAKIEMNVSATIENPQSFKIYPFDNETWLLSRFILTIDHSSEGDFSKFGDLNSLTNGVLVRTFISGQYSTFANWKNNKQIKNDTGELNFDNKTGGGNFGTSAVGSLLELDRVQAKINSANGDFMEVLIQDDLSALLSFNIKIQGLIEGA